VTNFNTPWEGISQHFAERQRLAENSARPADVFSMTPTMGSGETQVEDAIDFGLVFIQEPVMSYGYRVDEELGDELVPGNFPRSWGFVSDYVTNARGHYLGAYVSLIVEALGAPPPNYAITHYFRFQGIALKALPADEAAD
jgi:hypothetical protein